MNGMITMHTKADLFNIIRTLNLTCTCAHFLHRRQQQPNQYSYDGNHHQKLDQSKSFFNFRHWETLKRDKEFVYLTLIHNKRKTVAILVNKKKIN